MIWESIGDCTGCDEGIAVISHTVQCNVCSELFCSKFCNGMAKDISDCKEFHNFCSGKFAAENMTCSKSRLCKGKKSHHVCNACITGVQFKARSTADVRFLDWVAERANFCTISDALKLFNDTLI